MEVKRQGLTTIEVEQSRLKHGENVLTPPRPQSMWRLYFEKYQDPMVRILLVAAVVSLLLAFVKNDFTESLGIIAAIILATTVGFYFERDAARRFHLLTQMGEEQPVKVMREGVVMEVPRREVVVGDVVIVETGDEIPADGRLYESTDLQVDESSLTGEAMTTKEAKSKRQEARGEEGEVREEAYPKDMLLRSSMVMAGTGRYVVTAVGDETEIGHVARQATELTHVKTPLNIQLGHLAKLISKVGGLLSVAAFVVFLVHDILVNPLWHTTDYIGMVEVVLRYFMMAVTLIVMAVPEGLPMAVTLALALNMRRMLKSNNLVRKLQASETMGAVTVICTDKTGTLTENRMTVVEVKEARGKKQEAREMLYRAIALNTTATHDVGNPTEQALLRWLMDQGIDYQQLRNENPITAREPFSTERKYMTTTVGDTLYIKGAPEVVMEMLEARSKEQEAREEEPEVSEMLETLKEWQQHAMRTLAIGWKSLSSPLTSGFAIVAISDPLRQEVPGAIRQCKQAGIDVKIVTGDTAETAMEIARQCGIIEARSKRQKASDGEKKETITGAAFAALSDDEALKVVVDLKVMSRARPTDKQRLVALLQQCGEVVAVTGDGTNDAPALNRAHVGLSLGSGTSVAKQASDITLLDDSFRSIVHAVMWGRSLYKNIQRFVFFQLIVNVTALLLVLFGAFIGTEMPLTITQILWVNLIMDTFAAMALASLPPSREVLRERPRATDASIITRPMARGIVWIGGLFFVFTSLLLWYFERVAGINEVELTIFFTLFVLLQWWNLFNARVMGSYHSAFRRLWACPAFLLVLFLVLVGQWLIVTFGGRVFRTVPLSWDIWLWMFVVTSPVLWIGEVYRLIVARSKRQEARSEKQEARSKRQEEVEGYVATIGMFDGVHCGHQFVLRHVVDEAQRRGLQSMAVTFNRQCAPMLTPLADKLRLLSQCGIERTEVLAFDDALKQLTARQFMADVLKQRYGVRVLMIGYDNRFGHNRAEGFDDYVRYGRELGIDVLQLPAEGSVCSSMIRQQLSDGNVAAAAEALGRAYTVSGRVVHGEHVGTQMGFPTANLVPDCATQLLPAPGVYAVRVGSYGGMMNIGTRPTFDGNHQTLEVNIFDFDGDLYGSQISVSFVERLRDEQHFDSPEVLAQQLQIDSQQAKHILQ